MIAWGFIPARGGSKSIPLKNLVPVAGLPLIEYGIRAAQASGQLARMICSTDHQALADAVTRLGVEVDRRPENLGGDDVPVAEVAREFLKRQSAPPDVLVLIQPTSPFLLPQHVSQLLAALEKDPEAQSGHNVVYCSHNAHAWNQRILNPETGRVEFLFAAERKQAYNKQRKPKLQIFGNLIAARSAALLKGEGFYAEPVTAVQIVSPYEFDLDGPPDIRMAEYLLQSGAVELPHLRGG